MGAQMPRKYVAEMVVDRISASRNYLGDAYDDSQPLDYFLKSKEKLWFIHPQTKKELEALLRILNDHGEEKLLHYIKYRYLRGDVAIHSSVCHRLYMARLFFLSLYVRAILFLSTTRAMPKPQDMAMQVLPNNWLR